MRSIGKRGRRDTLPAPSLCAYALRKSGQAAAVIDYQTSRELEPRDAWPGPLFGLEKFCLDMKWGMTHTVFMLNGEIMRKSRES
jgi:hypothetical protein